MKIVYMGTPDFAVAPLAALVKNGYEVEAVITQPDKPKGRGKTMMFTPVKEEALKHVSWFQLTSAQKSICFHTFLAFQLYFVKYQYILSAGYVDTIFICAHNGTRYLFNLCLLNGTPPYFKSFSIDKGKCTWPWI